MPHEHINSTPAPRDPETGRSLERVTVGWTRAEELPDGELQTGDVRLASEWLFSEARLPTPEMFDVRIKYVDGVEVGRWTTPHTFGLDRHPKVSGADLCEYCGLEEDSACHRETEVYTPTAPRTAGSASDVVSKLADTPITLTRLPVDDVPVRDAVQTVHRAGAPTWSEPLQGFWVTLTRDDANHLVRKLRRAIRDAFGGDA